ncbi:MAG: hypothetical protein LBD20_02715 [Spirochaetaceae bacterium]|jgi:hypothetical protein|nr:hypothetical protein [Spirochaetaceae bacterium]
MKKHIVRQAAPLFLLYIAVFFVMVLVQWTRRDSFSHKIGGMVVTGRYSRDADGHIASVKHTDFGNEYDVTDNVNLTFNGMEFILKANNTGVRFTSGDGQEQTASPRVMLISSEYVRFKLVPDNLPETGGISAKKQYIELNFYLQTEAEADALVISSVLPAGIEALIVPFNTTQKTSNIQAENDELYVSVEGGTWGFDRPVPGIQKKTFTLTPKNPVIAYRLHGGRIFDPIQYIVAGAMEKSRFDEIVAVWKNKVYTAWTGQIAAGTNEALISAWVAETAERQSLSAALEKLPDGFVNNPARTYVTAPYLGRLPSALRSKSEFEKANLERLTRLFQTDKDAFLVEEKLFVYLAQRNYAALFDQAIQYIKTIQPDMLTIKLLPAVFEGWWAWNIWHNTEENPFEILVHQARLMVGELIKKDVENGDIFIVNEQTADIAYNARLGSAITVYGESSGNNEWAALGRSLVISCLAYSNDSGGIPRLLQENDGQFTIAENNPTMEALQMYQLAALSDYYPHAVGVTTLVKGVWIWTMSPSISASYQNNVLDFGILFNTGETHYMLISGLRPFSKIQMRDIDYRSDPQFENWNAPGWIYSPSEQTMLVKLVHRTPLEHIKIFF